MERAGQGMAVAQLVEMFTLVSALRLAPLRLPPAAPATLGAGVIVGSTGVMVGSQVVVSAEWVETMPRSQVLRIIARQMRRYNLPMNFAPWRGR